MAPHEQDSIPTEAVVAPSFKIVGKALEIPIVNDAVEAVTKLHNDAVTYPYVNQVETIIGCLLTTAEDSIAPRVSSTMSSTVTTTAAQLDTLACTGLDKVTARVPALKLPTGELATVTVNMANTVLDYFAKFAVVRLVITAFVMFLSFTIKGLGAAVGVIEGKTDMCSAAITTIVAVVKPVIGHIDTFKVLLEEVVKRNTPADVTKPVEEEKPKEE